MPAFTVGFVLFPDLTQLDLTGPLQVLARLPQSRIIVAAKSKSPVPSDCGLSLLPTHSFADCPPFDLICVPGGVKGVIGAIGDRETVDFVRRQAVGILSGFTPIGLFGEGNVIGQIRAGTMTPLVMLNNIHSPNFPQVPTLKETGYDGPPSRGWYGLFAPAGTPRPIVDRLAKEVAAIVAEPDFAQKQLKDRSLVGATSTPDAFAAEIIEDRKVAQGVVKAAGMAPE